MSRRMQGLVFVLAVGLAICIPLFAQDMPQETETVNQEVSMQENAAVSAVANAAEATVAGPESAAPMAEAESTMEPTGADTSAPPVEETRWLWAEIVSVDSVANQFTVRYLSYDSDEEKEMTMAMDKDTRLENFKSLSEMESGDNVSIDYVMDKSGTATARSISLQKANPSVTAPETEEVAQPAAVQTAPQQEITQEETTPAGDNMEGAVNSEVPAVTNSVGE